MAENVLYYGDNLEILRRYIEDESVDLVHLDPPFKSDQDYNILFADSTPISRNPVFASVFPSLTTHILLAYFSPSCYIPH